MSKEKDDNLHQEFEKSHFKGLFMFNLWFGFAGSEIYANKDKIYYIAIVLGMIFVVSKFLLINYNIIIDHVNILSFLNVMLIYFFLIIIGLILGVLLILTFDLIFLFLVSLGKIILKVKKYFFKKKWLNIKIGSKIKYQTYMRLNLIFFFIPIVILILGFSFQPKKNNVVIKTTYSQEEVTGNLEYFSGENYVIKGPKGYLVIPKDKIEYLFYPKIEQKKTGNQ